MTQASNTQASNKGTAVITGASTGIGATYADRLAQRGYDVILVARDATRLTAVAEKLEGQYGVRATAFPADLLDTGDLARVEALLRDDASISLLVNNAGIAVNGGFVEADVEAFDKLVRLNALVPTRLARAVLPGLIARKGGIVNISSVLALAPEMFGGVYSGTKAYLLNLSQALANEFEPQGVRVQAVLPGATRTEIWERSGTDIDAFPAEMVMDVNDLVDAALAGFDKGETVTIPPLEEVEEFDQLQAVRLGLGPKLSKREPGTRYRAAVDA